MNTNFRLAAPIAGALALASLTVAAEAQTRKRAAPPERAQAQGASWINTVELRDSGHVLGTVLTGKGRIGKGHARLRKLGYEDGQTHRIKPAGLGKRKVFFKHNSLTGGP